MKAGYFKFLLLFPLIFACSFAYATDLSHIPGAFVDIGFGARPMGMGGAFVGLADDRNAVMWNPAGMMKLQGQGISFMWAKQLGLIPYNYLCYSRSLGEQYRIGGGLIYSGDELMSETTVLVSFASSLGKVNPYLENVAAAVNLKIRSSSFGNNNDGDIDRVTGDAFGYGFDFGLMWFISPKISVGALFRDLFNDITWNSSQLELGDSNYSESVPFELTFGVSYRPTAQSVIAMDLRKAVYEDVKDRLIIGLEQIVFKRIFLRAGWGRNIGAKYGNEEIGLGIGVLQELKTFNFNFDFAYMVNDLKNTPRLGVSFTW